MSVKKIILAFFSSVIILLIVFYIYLWLVSREVYQVNYGISFSKEYTEALGLNWEQVYREILTDLKSRYLRTSVPWNVVESNQNNFDFSDIDWQMQEAEKTGTKMTLVIGQKIPRWPECFIPEWAKSLSDTEYQHRLFVYLKQTVERYKNNAVLEMWQVENEPFINFKFGECANFHRDLVVEEIKLVKRLDPSHPIIITDSGELSTWYSTAMAGDLFGTTVYRVVRTPSGRAWTYDWLPPASYRIKANIWGRAVDKLYVMEMQAEPWFSGGNANSTPLEIQKQTMNIARFDKYFSYVEHIGTPRAYLWGVEWWYWMKEKQGDNSFWEKAKNHITQNI